MDANNSSSEIGSFESAIDAEVEIGCASSPFTGWSTRADQEAITGNMKATTSTGSSRSKMSRHFVAMGFSEEMVIQAIDENGENEASILDSLLTYSAIESFHEEFDGFTESCNSEFGSNSADGQYDGDSSPGIKENMSLFEKDKLLSVLVDMGYSAEEASTAMEKCGSNAKLTELTDYICAAQMDKEPAAQIGESPPEDDAPAWSHPRKRTDYLPCKKKRKYHNESPKRRGWCKQWEKNPVGGNEEIKRSEKNPVCRNEEIINLPNPMKGFGIPSEPCRVVERKLPEDAVGPPFFYYENVALTPKGVWSTISRFLHEIEPEFVDSIYFTAAARKRGYVHNLPIRNRFPILPRPPLTIQEALPSTQRWWPSWDKRTKLNCLLTCIGSAKLTERIRKAIENFNGEPTPKVKQQVLEECRKWNLVWVGRNRVAPLEPSEMEFLLGFPVDHTRGGGISRTDRYKALGNSFQVDTVAYHLSVLKNLFPHGINVLSLFSGIGGAEVALHRLGIPMKNVVSVEISAVNRSIFRSWWDQTNQTGQLIEIADIQEINGDSIEHWIRSFGGFDLVIGGSPCNNLAGGNRVSRDGLEGKHSSLFFEYFRVLQLIKGMMGK